VARFVTAVLGTGLLVACGSSGGSDGASSPSTERATTTIAANEARTTEGEPITEPICEFLGLEARAAAVLPYPVTLTSAVGSNDSAGGSCAIESTTGEPKISVAVFPSTESDFDDFVEEFTAKLGPTGNRLWTDPEPVDDLGDKAVSFKAPDGGYDSFAILDDGYRITVSDGATTDIAGRAQSAMNLATEIVKYRQAMG
jgi:hypothetical protein